jgi:hypothetical protein
MATPATLLAQIDTAIEALLTGGASSYSIGSRTVTALDLGTLFEQRRMLQSEVDRESGGGMFRLAKFQRTSR